MSGYLRRRSLAVTITLGLLSGLLPESATAAPPTLTATSVAGGLAIPWDVAFAPDGTMLVTERAGRVRVYAGGVPGAALLRTIPISNVRAEGEAGLMGIAVDVDFASNSFVYVCASREYTGSGGWKNQVLRYTIAANGDWTSETILLTNMAANVIHNGCALEMDRFGKLWITMGDANNAGLAQNRGSLNGKVLRINRDGTVPSDNPLMAGTRDAVYSMGHRNPQGIAFRPGTDQVYAVEHGPDVNDEVNLIEPGGNYGWPCYTGPGLAHQTSGCSPASNYRSALWSSGSSTIATSGAAFASGASWADFDGHLWVSTLKERDTRRFSPDAAGTALGGPTTHFDSVGGRLRAMVSGPGGQLYVTTSNGTGDQVIRISPSPTSVTRISGPDRFATAAALSQAAYPSGAASVAVATGLDFPDALAGSAAAGNREMPVLLVVADQIPEATRVEIERLNPQRIYVFGGPGVVSEAVLTELRSHAQTGEVIRLWGADRFATAAAISAYFYASRAPAAFVAVGTNFADALAGAPAAALTGSPLLLVGTNEIPTATEDELDRLQPQRIYVLGGTGVISDGVASELNAFTEGSVQRLAGPDRYATGAAIVRAFWSRQAGYVATGRDFPDALAGGAVAGRDGVPILLADAASVPLTTGQEILRLGSPRLTMLGGIGALSADVESTLRRLIGSP
jgi:glucose/arabinose dehydrogenase/putative cell wall-binding protein